MSRTFVFAALAAAIAFSPPVLAQEEETPRDRAKLAVICGPALDLTLSRFGQDGLYEVSKTNPAVHEKMLRVLTLAKMGMTNYQLFSSFAVAKSTGRDSSEIAAEFKTAEAQARTDFGRFPGGKLPAQVQPVVSGCVNSIYRHDKAIEESTKKSLLEYLDANLPLYFPTAQ